MLPEEGTIALQIPILFACYKNTGHVSVSRGVVLWSHGRRKAWFWELKILLSAQQELQRNAIHVIFNLVQTSLPVSSQNTSANSQSEVTLLSTWPDHVLRAPTRADHVTYNVTSKTTQGHLLIVLYTRLLYESVYLVTCAFPWGLLHLYYIAEWVY